MSPPPATIEELELARQREFERAAEIFRRIPQPERVEPVTQIYLALVKQYLKFGEVGKGVHYALEVDAMADLHDTLGIQAVWNQMRIIESLKRIAKLKKLHSPEVHGLELPYGDIQLVHYVRLGRVLESARKWWGSDCEGTESFAKEYAELKEKVGLGRESGDVLTSAKLDSHEAKLREWAQRVVDGSADGS